MPSQETSHAVEIPSGMPDDSFAPLAALQTALRFWWFLSLLMIAGGVLGWLFHRANPPVYEAVSQFSFGIDFVRSGPLEENDTDLAMGSAGSLIYSRTVMQKVTDQAAKEGIETSVAELRRDAVIERRVDTWMVRLRGSDPQRVGRLSDIWVDQAQAVLDASYQNALKAEQLGQVLRSLESCLEKSPAMESFSGQCAGRSLHDIQADLGTLGKEYAAAQKASRGLFPGLNPGPVERAVVSSRPIILGRAQLVLAGGFLGLLGGLALLHLGFPERWRARS